MQIVQSFNVSADEVEPAFLAAADDISVEFLEKVVQKIAIPRHFIAEKENNTKIGHWICDQFDAFGLTASFQGDSRNVVALSRGPAEQRILIGAHYDSVPETPGADDNASAVAAMLGCARALTQSDQERPLCFVAFNREEDDLMGSKEFVTQYLPSCQYRVTEAHVLEMVGYCDTTPQSQRLPRGLPVKLVRDTGDFLAVLGNRGSTTQVDSVVRMAKTYQPDFPVIGLKIHLGLENVFRHLRRSDHAPFWDCGIPALMWTDTAEFRNPNYHAVSDTPETLNYEFLRRITQVLVAQTLTASSRLRQRRS